MNAELPVHGGDHDAYDARYGAGDWLDFSANINPDGPPPAVLNALRHAVLDRSTLSAYPTGRERMLRGQLAALHATTPSHIVIANGAAALIEAYVRTYKPRRCLLPTPAFSEYARALTAQDCEILPFVLSAERGFAYDIDALLLQLARCAADFVIITNPHNPSGTRIDRRQMQHIISFCATHHVMLLIDEAFIDYCAEAGVSDALPEEATAFVVRSLTKFYGMPGLRVGYGIASSSAIGGQISACIPSWPITSFAIDAALATPDDPAYARLAVERNATRRSALAQALIALDCTVIPSHANFLMFSAHCDASRLAHELALTHRIMVRDCASYNIPGDTTYLRVAVRTEHENNRLINALACSLGQIRTRSGAVQRERRADGKLI